VLTALGNISEQKGSGTSNYNALWVTGTKHFAKGLEFNANYTWSKSLDENSRNFQGIVVQNSLNPFLDYGPSDFDARHHFTFSGIYELPFSGNRFKSGWRIGTIAQLQSGNPLNILAGSPVQGGSAISAFTGVANTIRPDLNSALPSVGSTLIQNNSNNSLNGLIQYFSAGVCDPTSKTACTGSETFVLPVALVGGKDSFHFGNLHRNAVVGPGFEDVDFSLTKTTKITERLRNEFRVEAYDVLNHPDFANPGTTALPGSTTFGIIRATRNPTGDAGSSRQLQFAMKFIF